MKPILIASVVVGLFLNVGCTPAPKSARGFTLPDGDVERGKTIFVNLQCNACHKVAGIEQLVAEGTKPEISVSLGGEVTRISTYGELVTGIINPSHRLAKGHPAEEVSVDGQSKMKNYNDVMTVSQLIDLVAFLQSKYKLREYDSTDFPQYYGP